MIPMDFLWQDCAEGCEPAAQKTEEKEWTLSR